MHTTDTRQCVNSSDLPFTLLKGCDYGAEQLTWSNAVREVMPRKSP